MKKTSTDNQRLWSALIDAGRSGIHSFDIRAQLGSGNPSQRIAELEVTHDCSIPRKREQRLSGRGDRRWGTRYFHPDHAPAGLGGRSPGGNGPGLAAVEPSGETTPAEIGSGVPTASASDPSRAPDDEPAQLDLLPRTPAIYDDVA